LAKARLAHDARGAVCSLKGLSVWFGFV